MKTAYFSAAVLAISSTLWIASGVMGEEAASLENLKPQAEEKPLAAVRTQFSQAKDWSREIILFGHTEAVRKAEIKPETTGRIVARLIEKGAKVKKGEVLFKIAMDDRQARLNEGVTELEFRNIAYNAAKKLSRKNFQSKIRLAEEKAKLSASRAKLETIRLDVRRTQIRAPFDGTIEELSLEVGDYASPSVVAANIVALDSMRIVAHISERDITAISMNSVVEAVFPDGRVVTGSVKYISSKANEATRTFRIDAWFDNPDNRIQQGLTTELRLSAGSQKAHLISPAVLTLNDEGMLGIKSVAKDGTVLFHKAVMVSDTIDGIWLGNLPDQIEIITVGQEYVKPGQKVEIRNVSAGRQDNTAQDNTAQNTSAQKNNTQENNLGQVSS